MVDNSEEALYRKGFAQRMVRDYVESLRREDESDLFDPAYRAWAHERGFLAESACAYHLSDENIGQYLSDYDYFRVWPLNSWQRVWINDKLTLKYMLSGTKYDRFLPKYYYYSKPGALMPLVDSAMGTGREDFLSMLREAGDFACKPCNGECSQGFHKLSGTDDGYLIDNRPADADDVMRFVDEHDNYVFTEFFHPGGGMEKISNVIHTLRVLVVNVDGAHPVLASAYLRFATGVGEDDSQANYRVPDAAGICSFNLDFDLETGAFGNGRLVYGDEVVDSACHPDTGAKGEGVIGCWPELKEMIEGISLRLGPVEYMGFDVCVTDNGPRLIEINSHSGSKYLQLYHPFLADEFLSGYFSDKLAAIDALSPDEIARRNAMAR